MRSLLLVVLGLTLLAGAALAAPPVPDDILPGGDPVTFDVVGGGSPPAAWAVGLTGGYPWSSLRLQVGLPGGVTPVVSVETAVFRRWEPTAGVSGRFLDGPKGRLSGEILLGWTIEAGEVRRNGPRILGRLRAMAITGRAGPYVALATGHTLYFDDVVTRTRDGDTTERTVSHQWAPVIEAGVAVAILKNVGIEVGFDWHLVGLPDALALPGVHLGVQFGAGRRPAREDAR